MFRKIFIYFCLLSSIAFAINHIEIHSSGLKVEKEFIVADEGVEIIYQDTVIKAQKVLYDKAKHKLYISGNVEILGLNGIKEQAESIVIDTKNDDIEFKELFMGLENDIWITTHKAKKSQQKYITKNSILSSCEVENPVWKISFDKSVYDQNNSTMKLYNSIVYIKDIPIFYSPYLSFSTHQKRKSGLLSPLFGYSAEDGFIYEQPIFWAIALNMDLEINPQIRTQRGYGGYTTFRFVDTMYSKGAIRVGYFKDKDSYNSSHTSTDEHYGIEAKYDSSNIIADDYSHINKDGLYLSAIYLNDIDYIYLQRTRFGDFGESALQESKLNYYATTDNYYFGINAKYFIDTRTDVKQGDILQLLPSMHLYRYTDRLLFEHLLYHVDLHFVNYYRKDGLSMKYLTLNVPIEYHNTFFDDYVKFSISENLFLGKYYFTNAELLYPNFTYMSNVHKVEISSDLVKKYTNYVHVIQPTIKYIKAGLEKTSPTDLDSYTLEQQQMLEVGLPQEHIELTFGQYLYNTNMKLIFYQRLSQMYYIHKSDLITYRLGDLDNEMEYFWENHWSLYSNLIYSYKYNKLREATTRVNYDGSGFDFSLGHTIKRKLLDEDESIDSVNEIYLKTYYRYNENWKFNAKITYNINDSISKKWYLGVSYNVDCWGMDFSMHQTITPRPNGASTDNGFFIQFHFKPFVNFGTEI